MSTCCPRDGACHRAELHGTPTQTSWFVYRFSQNSRWAYTFLTLLGQQSRLEDKSVKSQVSCPENGTAVQKRSKRLWMARNITNGLVVFQHSEICRLELRHTFSRNMYCENIRPTESSFE